MNFFNTILVVIFISIGIVVLAPIFTMGAIVLMFLAMAMVWFLPIWIIATSDRTCGGEKLAWILAIIFLSWFAWIFYACLAPLTSESRHSTHYIYHSRREDRRYRDDFYY